MNYPQSDQIPLAPPRVPRRIAERKAEIENKINQSFRKSLEKYSTCQTFALFSFLTLIIGIEITEYLLPLCFTVLAVFYFFYLIRTFCDSFAPVDKAQTGYKILEFVVTVGLLINFRKPDDNGYLYICGTFLLVSFLIKALISYMANHSNTVKFMNMANKIIAIINACIFAQGAALLAQLSAGSPVPFVLVLIPTLIISGFITLFSAKLFEFIFFTYRSQFWDSDVNQKKKGIVWLFGNLVSLVFLLLSSFVSFCGVESKPKDSFVGLYFIIVIWCAISVCTLGSAKNGLYGIYYTLVMILETKEEADEMQKIKFVIKISNTYYRQATDQEVKQSKNQKHNANANDTEVELGNKGEEGVKCIVCCKDAPDSVFMLCGHGGVCFECAQEIRKKQECHMCRQRIKGLLKVNIENNKGNVYEVMTAVTTKDDEEEA